MEMVRQTPHEPRLASTTERILSAAGLVVGTSAAVVVAHFNPVTSGFFPQCLLNKVTGFLCPGCGLTRGFHALFHGDIVGALSYNAMIPIYVFIFGYLALTLLFIVFKGRPLSFNIAQPKLIIGFLILSFVFGIVRNFPLYPFTVLAP